jgi:dihydroxyacid dehydratase/phosphogluconate dehydratase
MQPIDGVVLLAGCDKTVPAQLMGAASAGKTAIMMTAGPRSCGYFQGRSIATSDIWTLAPDRFAGRIDDQEWDELEEDVRPHGRGLQRDGHRHHDGHRRRGARHGVTGLSSGPGGRIPAA